MKNNRLISSCALILSFVVVTGCTGLSKSYPERNYYMFDLPPVTVKYPRVKGATAEISRFNVSPGSDGKEFIYRRSEYDYESDFYNQYFRPPGAMLTEVTGRWLQETGPFEDVFGAVTQAYANYFIEGNVVRIYGDYRSSPKAVMEIQFVLLQYTTDSSYEDNTKVLFAKNYSSEIPIASATATSLMQGWNTALGEILNAFLADVSKNVKVAAPSVPGN